MESTENTFTCSCNHCSGHIAFEPRGVGEIVTCPHCGMDTQLFIPVTQPPPIPRQPDLPPRPRYGAMAGLAAGEQIFYSSDDVLVTRTRFIAHSQTFAIANITSVSMARVPPDRNGANALIGFGAVGVLVGLLLLLTSVIAGIISLLIGAGLLYGGISLHGSLKETYFVSINTAGQDIKTLSHKDADAVLEVIEALNKAIIARG